MEFKTPASWLTSATLLATLSAALLGCGAGTDASTDSSTGAAMAPGPAPVQLASASSDIPTLEEVGTIGARSGPADRPTGEDTLADMPALRPTPPTPIPLPEGLTAELREVAAFGSIADERERSLALWDEVFKVVGHPRCMNCHNVDGPVTQGDAMLPHNPMIVRGESTFGHPAMQCQTCHASENVAYVGAQGSIPGHEPWHVAPIEMGWQGLSSGEICAKIKNPDTNGDRTLDEIHTHHAEDGLVGWGWNPGPGRTPAPGTQALFGDLTRAWIDTGAECPQG